jgi:hypothetical protein
LNLTLLHELRSHQFLCLGVSKSVVPPTESASSESTKIRNRAAHLIKDEIYTVANLGRKLEDGETLHDAVSKILSEWNQRQATLETRRASISVSKLKQKSRRKGILPPDVGNEKALKRFTLIPSSERPVEVLDCRKNLIAFRCSVPIDLIANLEQTEALLPPLKAHNTGRGLFPHRHYAAWGDFAKDVYHSKEYRDDFPHSQNWLDANRALWDYLSNLLRLVRPEMWKTANNFKFLKEKHLAGAWSGMAINQDTKDGGDVHQDWQDSQRVFNCVVPFGIFSGADLVLWQAGLRFQLSRGEVLFFFGSLLAHHVTKVTSGRRSVVDLFTHKSNFDVRKRKFKATENRETYRKWGLEKKARAST